ncbi:hypothetical protein P7C73_g769, partial [Tremellales sp. Uapishka_1]
STPLSPPNQPIYVLSADGSSLWLVDPTEPPVHEEPPPYAPTSPKPKREAAHVQSRVRASTMSDCDRCGIIFHTPTNEAIEIVVIDPDKDSGRDDAAPLEAARAAGDGGSERTRTMAVDILRRYRTGRSNVLGDRVETVLAARRRERLLEGNAASLADKLPLCAARLATATRRHAGGDGTSHYPPHWCTRVVAGAHPRALRRSSRNDHADPLPPLLLAKDSDPSPDLPSNTRNHLADFFRTRRFRNARPRLGKRVHQVFSGDEIALENL